MKYSVSFVIAILTVTQCLSQNFSSLSVLVSDDETGKPIEAASVIIKEAGWATKITGSDGKAFFDKSMPVGEIRFIVSKEGYQGIEGAFNITTEERSNSLNVKLSKFQDEKLLIIGEIVDDNNNDLEGVIIEIRIADMTRTTKSDASGNYKFIVPLGKTPFDASSIRFEIKCSDGNHKISETVPVSKTNTVYKDFKISCLQLYLDTISRKYSSFQLGLLPFLMVASRQQGDMAKYKEQRSSFIKLCKKFNFPLKYDEEELTPEFILSTVFSNLTPFMSSNELEVKEGFLLSRNFDELLVTWFFSEETFKEAAFYPILENFEKFLKNNTILSKELNEEGLNILKKDFRSNIKKGYQTRALNYYNLYNWMNNKVDKYLFNN
ncbi:MAG: collagen binding domain-containing protein [Saprospiraceae bacterium]